MSLLRRTSDAISPTAHYTGYVWTRNGLSAPGFETLEGRLMYDALRPVTGLARVIGVGVLEDALLARHRVIDHLLTTEIEAGRVTQVIEVAAGLSPRGWRFSRDFPDLFYVEADLPAMAARKRRVLGRIGYSHRVEDLDALADDGPLSLASIAATLDPQAGLAIITEGLLMYFDRPEVEGMWRRFASALGGFEHGIYLSDLHLHDENNHPVVSAGRTVLGWTVRGQVHFSFADEADARNALRAAGFAGSEVHRPAEFAQRVDGVTSRNANVVRVIEARA
jgi:O-methyltransferase involved in polyketide biosynthesis